MAIGHLVFPTIMAGVVVFVVGFVVATPATPPTTDASQRNMRAEPGDRLLLELTIFYGPAETQAAFFTTQEERAASLPKGAIELQSQEDPVGFQLSNEARELAVGLSGALVGHRVGESVRSGVIPGDTRTGFGEWTENLSLPRNLEGFGYTVRFTSDTPPIQGRPFSATNFVAFWKQRGTDLTIGTQWPCDAPELWKCRITELDLTNNVVSYQRQVRPGDSFPAKALFAGVEIVGDIDWKVTAVDEDFQHFTLRLDPPTDTKFQVRDESGVMAKGSYWVQSLTDETIEVRFSDAADTDLRLVGQPIVYEAVIVRIQKP